MKRLIALLICTAMIFSMLSFNMLSLASVTETESNNNEATANAVETGVLINGSLSDGADKDYYRLEITKPGYIEIKFTNPLQSNSNAAWAINVYCLKDTAEIVHSYTAKGNTVSTSLPKIGVDMGTYYICVSDGYYGYGIVKNVTYGVRADFTATAFYETEGNDSYAAADDIAFSEGYGGCLNSGSDKDYFKLSVDKKGYIKIEFANPVINSDNCRWHISVIKLAESYEEIHAQSLYATTAKKTLPEMGLEPGTYYICISDGYHGYGNVNNEEYKLKVAFTATDKWEYEKNGSYEAANPIVLGEEYGGYLNSGNDSDYFEFTVAEKGYIEIEFSNAIINSDNCRWHISVIKLSESYEEIHAQTLYAKTAKKSLPKMGLESGTYYICISDGYHRYGNVSNAVYMLKTTFTATEHWEYEKNNSYETANPIVAGEEYGGYLNSGDDKDCFVLNIKEKGCIQIDFFNPVKNDDNARWDISVVRLTDSYDTIHYQTLSATNSKKSLPEMGVEPGLYYIVVNDGYHGYGNVNNVEYKIKTVFTPTDFYESEDNGDFSKADVINSSDIYHGYLSDGRDADFYRVNIASRGRTDLLFTNPLRDSENIRWTVTVYSFGNEIKEVLSFNTWATSSKTVLKDIDLEPGAYYIKVEDGYFQYGNAKNLLYSLCLLDAEMYKPGDVDEDKTVSSADARYVLRRAVGLEILDEFTDMLSDVDYSGDISSADARLVLRCAVGLEEI